MTSDEVLGGVDRRTVTIFGIALVSLWGAHFGVRVIPDDVSRLTFMCWWAGSQIFFYLIVPIVFVVASRGRMEEIGWKVRGTSTHWKVYVGLLLIAAPFVFLASTTTEFQHRYPLYDIVVGQSGVWGDLAVWWPFYFLQFVAVETFFRGFLAIGLSRQFGSVSVLIATVPYLMIHFVKPPAEAAAAIVGGIVMGTLAVRTRSIWWGVGLHVTVAALMDVLSLGHKGFIW